jgi:hypothetical protein
MIMESLFFLSKSFWIFLFQSLISFFNPDALNNEAKIKLFESGIDSGIIYLRSIGFNATYDDFYADIEEDKIQITNLSLKREFEPEYNSFCDLDNLELKSIWHPKLCEFSLSIDEIIIKGIELGYKSDDPVSIEFIGINHDLSNYNTTEFKAVKKLLDLENSISGDFKLDLKYDFSKNIFSSNINFSVNNFGLMNLSFVADNIVYNDENYSLNLDKFRFSFEDQSFVEKFNTLSDIEGEKALAEIAKEGLLKRSTLNVSDVDQLENINTHNDFINSVEYYYPNYNANILNLIKFLEEPNYFECNSDQNHLINNPFMDDVEVYGFPLIIAAVCKNISLEDNG